MATLSVRLDLYVFKLKAYKIVLKVKKFKLLICYHFSTAEGDMAVGGFRPPRLNRVNPKQAGLFANWYGQGGRICPPPLPM